MRILLVEDDTMLGRATRAGLVGAGFAVDWVQDGHAAEVALADAEAASPGGGAHDLVVLDLGLPRRDGMVLLRAWRARGVQVPVLVATARDAVADRIQGLQAGADDYVLKPFDLDELIARVRAVLRRRSGQATPVLACGTLTLDPVRHAVALAGQPVALSPREFALLEALMQLPGAVLSRQRLEDSIYGWGQEVCSNAVEVHLHSLRRKLGADLIRNVRGVGYRVGLP